MEGFLKREEGKKGIFHVVGQGQREGELKDGRETLWEDKAMAEGVEVL